jgi:hypothetical protein
MGQFLVDFLLKGWDFSIFPMMLSVRVVWMPDKLQTGSRRGSFKYRMWW